MKKMKLEFEAITIVIGKNSEDEQVSRKFCEEYDIKQNIIKITESDLQKLRQVLGSVAGGTAVEADLGAGVGGVGFCLSRWAAR